MISSVLVLAARRLNNCVTLAIAKRIDDPAAIKTSAGEYTRSRRTEEAVLGHQRSEFLWTSVQAAGKAAKNFGEFV